MTSSCRILAQADYKARHDNAAKIIHKDLATNLNLLVIQDTTLYVHSLKTPSASILGRTIFIDLNRPDTIVRKKHTNEGIFIVPNTHNTNILHQSFKISTIVDRNEANAKSSETFNSTFSNLQCRCSSN